MLTSTACPCSLARNVHLRRGSLLWLVPLSNSDSALHLVLPPQCCRLAQDSAIPPQVRLTTVYRLATLRPAVLGYRSLVQLFLLQRLGL